MRTASFGVFAVRIVLEDAAVTVQFGMAQTGFFFFSRFFSFGVKSFRDERLVCLVHRHWRPKQRVSYRQDRREIGDWLHARRIADDITVGQTPATFEPAIDYVCNEDSRF